jgi:hypothetical protein
LLFEISTTSETDKKGNTHEPAKFGKAD